MIVPLEFERTMSLAAWFLENPDNTREDKRVLLDYMIHTIKLDLKYTLATAIFYEPGETLREINALLPSGYEDGTGRNVSIFDHEKIQISLQDTDVFSLPWRPESLQNKVKTLAQEDFVCDSNHMAVYYSGIDLCYAFNGIHSITAGNYFKKGVIEADVLHAERLFPHIRTDGVQWINAHTSRSMFQVSDFRIALIYELCRLRQELK